MEILLQDLRYAARTLIRKPGFTAMAVIALALGIGANSAIFSIVNTVLLRPLPYPEPERLVMVWEHSSRIGRFSISVPNFVDWQQQNQVFRHLAAISGATLHLAGGDGEPARLRGLAVTSSYFDAIGVKPWLGRALEPAEDRPGAEPVAVLSHKLWESSFGADAGIVGRTVTLSGRPTTIVGVMPADTGFPKWVELYTPLALDPVENSRGAHFLSAIGRLKPGVTPEQADA
jgi:putative ABC transport system permease protein